MFRKKTLSVLHQSNPTIFFIIGIILGSFAGRLNRHIFLQSMPCRAFYNTDAKHKIAIIPNVSTLQHIPSKLNEIFTDQNLVLIGVMTAKEYLNTRALAALNTWVQMAPGKVIFFSSEGSELIAPEGLEIIGLKGVDDSYPPQKKSFAMLKYMHDNYINDYRFFLRADDDVYIRGNLLAEFLHSIDDNYGQTPLFIGQAGLGSKHEAEPLYLHPDDNFCMGGTTIIINRATLSKLAPNIPYCLANVFTNHEDVELGRCIARHVGVSCTWAYEMQKLLYNNYKEPKGSFTHSLNDPIIANAITLHPIKNHKYLYRLHQHILSKESMRLRNEILQLQREISYMDEFLLKDINSKIKEKPEFNSKNKYSNNNGDPIAGNFSWIKDRSKVDKRLGLQPSLLKFRPSSRDQILTWDFLSKHAYSAQFSNPRRNMETHLKNGLDNVILQVMELINKDSQKRGRIIDFKELLYGYNQVDPLHGANYILDLLLVYRKYKGKQRLTLPVRRHAYIQQPFLELESQIEDITHLTTKRINFILPLSGRFKTLLQFMLNFEEVCLRTEENVSLLVVLFQSSKDDRSNEIVTFLEGISIKYPNTPIDILKVEGEFSRGQALQEGSQRFLNDDLLFFIDVDMNMERDVLFRIRTNTIKLEQVYYPIVFSQYSPEPDLNPFVNSTSTLHRLNSQSGYWRQFGYGIVSLYKCDFESVGGFDLSIKGWGLEDVDLYDRFIAASNTTSLRVLRAPDPGLSHVYHSIECRPDLDASQFQMCLGSKAASYGSVENLARKVFEIPEIMERGGDNVRGKK